MGNQGLGRFKVLRVIIRALRQFWRGVTNPEILWKPLLLLQFPSWHGLLPGFLWYQLKGLFDALKDEL